MNYINKIFYFFFLMLSISINSQRAIENPSFEINNLSGSNGIISDSNLPGWNSTSGKVEIWKTGFRTSDFTFSASEGDYFVELNPNVRIGLYQDVCLTNGETLFWTFDHHARQTGTETIVYEIVDANGNLLQTLDTSSVTRTQGWQTSSGTKTYTGPTGTQRIQFRSTVPSGSLGNLLDNIQIKLVPSVEFTPNTLVLKENKGYASENVIAISGNVTEDVIVGLSANSSSTATNGVDYNLTNSSITIPAGIYDGTAASNSLFSIPLDILNDDIYENPETLVLDMINVTGSNALIASIGCSVAQSQLVITIIDEMVLVNDTKTTEQDTPVVINIIENDTELTTNGTITATNPTNGSVVITDPNGTPNDPSDDVVTYNPNTGFYGTDTFEYTICDTNNVCETAQVTVTVNPDPCDPVASGNPDSDSDGVSDFCDLDDDNDGILDTDEGCFNKTNDVSNFNINKATHTANLNSASNGFGIDITRLDNSFSVTVNGTSLFTNEVELSSAFSPIPQTIQFADGTRHGAGSIPQIWAMGAANEATPLIRIIVYPTGEVQVLSSKTLNGPLEPMILTNGLKVNLVSWNTTNEIVIDQVQNGPTYAIGSIYGYDSNCAPVAIDDNYTTDENTPVILDPLNEGTQDNDPDGDVLTITSINGETLTGSAQTILVDNGTVEIDANGVITLIPNNGFSGTITFPYEISDGNGGSDEAIITIVVISDEVTTGNSGGVESESLGDAISKIYVGRKKNSVPTKFVKSKANLYIKSALQAKQPYQGKGQTMLDMFPTELIAGDVANITSPTDILDYTIADEVLSVDFSIDGKTKGVVLGIKTSDKVYNHTKASCDRLRGAEILNIKTLKLNGYNFLMQGIKQRNGVVEYAISFAVAKNNNDADYTIQTNWYVNHYIKFNDVYNFQVWTTNPKDTQKLVKDVLDNLNSYISVKQTESQTIPQTYAAKVWREKAELKIKLRSIQKGKQVELTMQEVYSETANNVKYRNKSLNTELEQIVSVEIADGYEYDGLIKVADEVQDAFYHADGNWGLDFDKNYTKIKNYFVYNDFHKEYKDGEHTFNRNVEIEATSDYDYLTLYKALLPGNLSADYSEYKYLSFTAKGSGLMELGLIKSSIEDWKEQYRVMVDFSEEEQTYYVPFEIFSSTGSQETITADDLTTLVFTFLPVEAQTKKLDLKISDVKFTKTAVEEYTVGKIEKFENEFMAYPNPSEGNVKVTLFSELDSKATVTLTDITGKTIYKAPTELVRGKNELDFNFKVRPGIMFLKVSSTDTNYGVTKLLFR
jgi:hypothetical protein